MSTVVATLSGDSFSVASLVFDDEDGIRSTSSVDIGLSSNVIKFEDQLLAFNNESGNAKISAFSFAHQMQKQDFGSSGQFPGYVIDLINEYGKAGIKVFNNLSYRIQYSLMYRRADYIFSENSNVSAV